MDKGKDKDLKIKEAQPDYERLYSVEEYYDRPGDIRAELYEGFLVVMENPTTRHQGIQSEIFGPLWVFLKGKNCKVFASNFGVKPFDNERTVFLPDVVVVCDKKKIGNRSYEGAPDFVVEILSPSTARMDKKLKYEKYEKAGVKEYWIVDPELKLVEANVLVNNKYISTIYNENDRAPVHILDGFEIDLAEVFAE